MLIIDARGRCFVRTQQELAFTVLKVHRINKLPEKTVNTLKCLLIVT